MTQAAICDNCKEVHPANGSHTRPMSEWLALDGYGYFVCRFGGEPLPLHFCSWGCLAAYAGNRANHEAREQEKIVQHPADTIADELRRAYTRKLPAKEQP